MQHNTDNEKATACQKAPTDTQKQMDAMIQRSKDYGLKVAVPNMKTDTQPEEWKLKTWPNGDKILARYVNGQYTGEWTKDLNYMKTDTQLNKQLSDVWESSLNEARRKAAQADKLAEALRECLAAHSRDNYYYNSLRRVASAQAAKAALADYEAAQ